MREQSKSLPKKVLRQNIEADKARALEAIARARRELGSLRELEFTPDITGNPAASRYQEFKRDQRRGLEATAHAPFFCRVDSQRTMDGQTESIQLLLSKARDMGGVIYGEDWEVVSWTSPIANLIQGKRPGDRVEFTTRKTTTYSVGESARYESLIPRVTNASFMLWQGDASIASEGPRKPKDYRAAADFGLTDIIVLADEPQRAALALPFDRSVIIEGPPGSGKTSIGIMRVAVLYDQQWEMLGLRRDRDSPFHSYSSMRILVQNDEMVAYLKGLAQSIGVQHARVETSQDFFRRICRDTLLLRGTRRRDQPSLAALKARRDVLALHFSGFQKHLLEHWPAQSRDLRRRLGEFAPDYLTLADCIEKWVARVAKATVIDGRIVGPVKLVDDLSVAHDAVITGRSSTRNGGNVATDQGPGRGMTKRYDREFLKTRSADAKKCVEDAIRQLFDRTGIARAMFSLPQYREFLRSLAVESLSQRTIDAGDRLWRRQYEGESPSYSQLDLAISAWLGASVLVSTSPDRKPWIGGKSLRLTHLVVDEAQDLSPSHVAILASQLVENGTLTLVGDLHQSLDPHVGVRSWDEATVRSSVRTVFGVNHRQTKPLGDFLAGTYTALFEEACPWKASPQTVGDRPRARGVRSWSDLSQQVASETKLWRERIPNATVAVLYDGKLEPKRLRRFQADLENLLSDDLVPVESAIPGERSDVLARTDHVLIASVKQTKGLEFDVVVFLESRNHWSKPIREIDARIRNGLYVAVSRARAGLSLCMRTVPPFVAQLSSRGLCEV
jgi:hypothetical protein